MKNVGKTGKLNDDECIQLDFSFYPLQAQVAVKYKIQSMRDNNFATYPLQMNFFLAKITPKTTSFVMLFSQNVTLIPSQNKTCTKKKK